MGPKGINWTEAFQYYCSSEDGKLPSYSDVALKFDVSKTEVGQRAVCENWTEFRQKLYENTKSDFLSDKRTELASADERHLTKWRQVQNYLDIFLSDIEANLSLKQVNKLYTVARTMKTAIEGERSILGLSNV